MELELFIEKKIQFESEKPNEILFVKIDEVIISELYGIISLGDWLNQIDENPLECDFFDIEKVLEEIECEYTYDELYNSSITLISKLFIEMFLQEVNKEIFKEYSNNIISGEVSFYGMFDFTNEENEEEEERFVRTLTSVVSNDLSRFFIADSERVYSDELFYIVKFSSYY